ncbi:hypothetical protein BDV37DRAFT_280989 [Aspergillus pseudonomiae]|uniref:Jacalin-type lectin domain-containing protein n=1 Tax=Aspergillus pseudonomiae TaxID=1506151 RepID=A0A5N7DIY0_9EURO|nr:uncharacterized protein BDV37DRAFT_280989 [Aspergillus pseudonomiae]KAE8406401.1 hypothetical protein BDV37DRAFT_280989 [Aspergillus pseudonomiae]
MKITSQIVISIHFAIVSPVYTSTEGSKQTLNLSYGEQLTYIGHTTYEGISQPTRMLMNLQLQTSRGQYFVASPIGISVPGVVHSSANVYSGFLVGIVGRANRDGVHRLGICVLQEIREVHIDMEYLSLPEGGISDVAVNNYTHDNREGKRDGSIVVDDTESITNSATTQKTWAESLGVGVTVSGKVFGMGAEGSTEYTVGNETMESTSYSRTRETHVGMTVGVPAGKKYWVEVLYYKGTFRVSFRPKYSFELKNGVKVNWPWDEEQPISGVAWGNLFLKVHDMTNTPDEKVPPPLPSPRKTFLVTRAMKRSRNEQTVLALYGTLEPFIQL